MRSTGTTVPSALDTCVTATSLVRSLSSFWYSSRRTWPVSSTGITRSVAPFSAASICQGTMFAWCSRCDTTISSPSWMFCLPHENATRFTPSVAPRTKTISSDEPAPRNFATLLRADS